MTFKCECNNTIELKTVKVDNKWSNYWYCSSCNKKVEPVQEKPPYTMSEDTYLGLIYGLWRP